ncbi:MAG: hypothetical protein IAE89_00275, partial [Anaerolineae bacterium]|nr:hypothetical protein [Anaerolineae bacterium]
LPIRTINFDDPDDVAKHDRMVSLVEEMIALKQQHAKAEAAFSDQRNTLAARIDSTDRAIDALVYELYALTPEEIAIVEGQSAP